MGSYLPEGLEVPLASSESVLVVSLFEGSAELHCLPSWMMVWIAGFCLAHDVHLKVCLHIWPVGCLGVQLAVFPGGTAICLPKCGFCVVGDLVGSVPLSGGPPICLVVSLAGRLG